VADALIAIGIVGEVSFSMLESRYQNELRRRSNKELAEAKLELARVTTPRCELLPGNSGIILEKLAPFTGTKFAVGHIEFGREHCDFLWVLEEILAKAGWAFVDWFPGTLPHPGVFRKTNWTMQRHTYGVANVSNVVLELEPANREALLPAAKALADALNEIGIRAALPEVHINPVSMTKNAIHILVGPKE
jgi:hypothetical protein